MKKLLVIGVIILLAGMSVPSGMGQNSEKDTLDAGELAYWRFDEGTGSIAHDDSGNGYDGDIFGATWTTGYNGFALNFNGLDTCVDLDIHSEHLGFGKSDCYIIDVYVKSSASTAGMIYSMSHIENNNLFCDLEMGSNGEFIFSVGTIECILNVTSDMGYNDGEWHHIEANYYGYTIIPTLEIWVDGSLENNITDWQCPFNKDDFDTAKIGRRGADELDYFDGVIDEVRLFYYTWGNHTPEAPVILGDDEIKVNKLYKLKVRAFDADGDDLRYCIDWGDGDIEWTGYHAQDTYVEVTHKYSDLGTPVISAYAQDIVGNIGPMGTKSIIVSKSNYWDMNWLDRFPLLQRLMEGLIR